jgi:hypothetical protein
MPNPTNSEFKKYANYAAHCLQMVTAIREMAAEWIRLADDLLDRKNPKNPRSTS